MKGCKLVALLMGTMLGAATGRAAPALPPGAKASADNIVLTVGTATVRIKHIEVAGSSLSDADLAAIFASKDGADVERRLRGLDATSVQIPELVVDQAEPRGEAHSVHTQLLLADIHAGRASTGSAGSGTVTVKTDKANVTITIGATTFKGLDLAQIVHVAAATRAAGEEAKPLCDDIAANAVTILGAAGDKRPVTIATIHETGLKGRPPEVMQAKEAPATSSPATGEELSRAFSADLVDISDVAVAPTTDAIARDLKSFALKHAVLSGLGDGKLARFAIEGLAVDSKPGSVKVASAEVLGVGASGGDVPAVNKIDLRDASVDVAADDARPDERIGFTVAHAAYEAPGLVIGRLPSRAALQVEHLAFDVPANNAAAPVLLAMGYKHVDLSSSALSRYDPATRSLSIDRFSLSGADMGTLDLKLDFANVSDAIVSQDDEAQKAAAASVLVKTVDVTLHDAGLVDKAIAFKAAVDGIGLGQERTNITQLIDTGLVGFGLQGSAKAQAIVAALHKFVVAPKTLHLALSSKEGLGAASVALIGDPQALLDALDVQASAGP